MIDTVLAIVQARMGSTRLPGKSMMKLNGIPALQHVLTRLAASRQIDTVAVATSLGATDDLIAEFCGLLGVYCYRGSEDDVLDRYYRCAVELGGDVVVRITGDCPLIDPDVVDSCISLYFDSIGDGDIYCSNCVERSYPDGLDVEVFSLSMLSRAWHQAEYASEREHVTPYMRTHYPQRHLILQGENYSSVRLTLDYAEDYAVLDALIRAVAPDNGPIPFVSAVEWLQQHPDYAALNAKYEINEGLAKSLREDRKVLNHMGGTDDEEN